MASDRRAARLGVLAAVAVMLFSGLGARLWFLQTVEAESLQQVVDQRNTSTVLIAPERGRSSTMTVASSPATNRSTTSPSTGRHCVATPTGPPCSVACPVGSVCPSRRWRRATTRRLLDVAAAADRRGHPRGRHHRPQRTQRGLPRRHDGQVVPPGVPVRTARRPRDRLHGGDHKRGRAHYEGLGYDTSNRGEEVGRAPASSWSTRRRCTASGARSSTRSTPMAALSRDQPQGCRERDGRPPVDRSRCAAVRRAFAANSAAFEAGVHCPQPGRREA